MSDDRICVGSIGGAYGVQGEVRIKSFCAVPEDIESYAPLTTEDGSRSFTLAILRPIKNGFAGRIAEVATKEQADALKGTQLYASRDQLPNLPDDEYYYTDLIGLKVFDTGGAPLGRVKSVQNRGASDLLEVPRHPELQEVVNLPLAKVSRIGAMLMQYQAEGVLREEHPIHAVAGLLGPLIIMTLLRGLPLPQEVPEVDLEAVVDAYLHGRHL